ncbi:hypothetical protein PR048_020257 [Dryococelus australis]|uniref:Uncharacterized protein n=1 Tax=Dryococelus australis TaxID=614101 RepID=A0ABQ9H5T0_9NEOP|nr:hypothetical protein PR048_020257 [Dryococelus australis]
MAGMPQDRAVPIMHANGGTSSRQDGAKLGEVVLHADMQNKLAMIFVAKREDEFVVYSESSLIGLKITDE